MGKPFAAMLYDNMVEGGGLPDDFDGVITDGVYGLTNYDGKIDHYVLGARLSFLPDEESGWDPFEQWYSIGDLKLFVPCDEDGTPVDLEGKSKVTEKDHFRPFVAQVGSRQMSKSSNFGILCESLEVCEVPKEIMMNPDIRSLIGLRGHWNRHDQPERAGLSQREDGRKRQVLVLTDFEGMVDVDKPKKSTAEKGTAKKTTAKVSKADSDDTADTGDEGDVDYDSLSQHLVAALSDGDLPQAKVMTSIRDWARENDADPDTLGGLWMKPKGKKEIVEAVNAALEASESGCSIAIKGVKTTLVFDE